MLPKAHLYIMRHQADLHSKGDSNSRNGKQFSYRPVAAKLTNGFFTVDKKWIVKYWNKAAEKIFGVAASEIVGNNLWSKFSKVFPAEFETVYKKAFQENIPLHFEEHWGEMGAWFDVTTYYCDDSLSVSFKSSKHRHSGIVKPEQRLKTLTELYRFVTEITNDSLWEWDFETEEILWIDGGHKKTFGYEIENALIPQSFWESRIHPDDKVRVLNKLNKIIAAGSVTMWEDEYRFAKMNGSYAYVHDRGRLIYKDGKASRMIGATQDITRRIMLEKKIEQERLNRHREITSAVLATQEKERWQLGTALHENIAQILVASNMFIQMAKNNASNWEKHLDQSVGYITDVIHEITKLHKQLVIPDVKLAGLFDNITNLAGDLTRQHSIRIEFFKDRVNENKINENLQVNIYRIIQEQLNNILQHAEAKNAIITLSEHKNILTLTIRDNGKGWERTEKRKGLGISNIITRAELLHGNVRIVSKPGEGFVLKVMLPMH